MQENNDNLSSNKTRKKRNCTLVEEDENRVRNPPKKRKSNRCDVSFVSSASASDSKSSPSSVKVEAKSKQIMTNKTPAMLLQELSTQRCGHGPTYDLITLQQGTHENLFEYVVHVLDISATGRGRSKKEAKQETAKNALLLLQDYLKSDCEPFLAQTSQQLSPDDESELPKVVNYIGELDDLCLRNNITGLEYDLIDDCGPPHQKIFTYEGRLGQSIRVRNTANTKKQARQNVAKMILERLEGIEISPYFGMSVWDMTTHLTYHLAQLKLTFKDIEEFFEEPHNEDKMRRLLEKLELELQFLEMSEEGQTPCIVSYSINSVIPLCTMASATTMEEAKQRALDKLFFRIRTDTM